MNVEAFTALLSHVRPMLFAQSLPEFATQHHKQIETVHNLELTLIHFWPQATVSG